MSGGAHAGPSAPSRGVRLLIVIGQLDVGGAEGHLAGVLPALQKSGIEVTVFALKGGGLIADRLGACGVPVVFHPRRVSGVPGLTQAAVMLRGVVRRKRPDVIHFFLPAAYLVGALATLGTDAKRVMSRRSLSGYQARYPGVRGIERWLHRRMDAVLANSKAVALQLLEEGVPDRRLGLIYNGVPVGPAMERKVARERLGLPVDGLILACVANLLPYKGHSDLIAALETVRAELPDGWLLLMLGRDDGIGSVLRAQAARAGVAENIRWLGSVSEVADYLAAADIGILASHEEGFSNAVLEGMAAGLPMVVTNVGGNPEAVIDGECGCVVPPRSPAALGKAIADLANQPEKRSRWGAAARRRVEALFDMTRCVELYRALYVNLLEGVFPPIPPGAMLPRSSGSEAWIERSAR